MNTVGELVHEAEDRLALAGIPDARLEAELLWMAALGLERSLLYAHLQHRPEQSAQGTAEALLARPLRREPAAYLRGQREFYALPFHVAPGVFIPRPETETLVEEALRLLSHQVGGPGTTTVADVGTGCGAIAVSVAVHDPQVTIYATDISAHALGVAKLNAEQHGVSGRVHFLLGDLLSPLPQPVDLLLANLPYVMTAELSTLEPEIRLYEPSEALDGGPDGLQVIGRLLTTAPSYLNAAGSLLLEMDPRQMEEARGLAREAFPGATLRTIPDLAGRPRVLEITPR